VRERMAICSVCGKHSDEVVRLFVGKQGNVCSECVEMCARILWDKGEAPEAMQEAV
jgi:ATP-dependent Clp protease ATP-binding subunit ClpX